MRTSTSLALAASLACLAGTSSAQVVTVSVANAWTINTDSGPVFALDSQSLTGVGTEFLNVNSHSTGGRSRHGPAGDNRTQSNVQGERRQGSIPLSASTNVCTHSYASYLWGLPTFGTVMADGDTAASGILPRLSKINMSGSSQITFILGIFGTTINVSSTSSAVVTAPGVVGKKLGMVNRLVLNQGPPIVFNGPVAGFYYSSVADASAQAMLKKKQTAFFHIEVTATATISLF